MFAAVGLLFAPQRTWDKILANERGMAWVLFTEVLPCLLLGVGLEYLGLTRWGDRSTEVDTRVFMDPRAIQMYALFHIVAGLLVVFLSAYFVHAVAMSFNLRSTYAQAIQAVGYGILPIFLVKPFDAIPALPTWLVWAVGAFIAIRFLYGSIGVCMKPEQTKGFGLFTFGLVSMIGMSALAQFVGMMILRGRWLTQEAPGATSMLL